MPHNTGELEVKTEDVNEILTAQPKWLLRFGTTIILVLILLFILISYFISYPDVLIGQATVTTLNPPVKIVARIDSKLEYLLVRNNQKVLKNEIIAVLENTANYKDIMSTYERVSKLDLLLKTSDTLPSINYSDSLNLGEITTEYLKFLKSYHEYLLFSIMNPQLKEISILDKELKSYSILLAKTELQAKLFREEFTLVEKDYNRDLRLFNEKVISAREFENKEKEFLQAKSKIEGQAINLANLQINKHNIEKNKLQLQIQYYERFSNHKIELEQSIKNFLSVIEIWKNKYLLTSPICGKVSFFTYWKENQNIKIGEEAFSIVPTEKQKIIVRLMIPSENSGKVQSGQIVNIKLDNYPYMEYGMLRGKVKNISQLPNKNTYMVEVDLELGLKTTYNILLQYKEEMTGQGQIITENLNLLTRMFNKLKKTIDRK